MVGPEPHTTVATVTARIRERSASSRASYLARVTAAAGASRPRSRIGCANLAHAMAACPAGDKSRLRGAGAPNLAIVTAYNDMLSAHKPYEHYPERLRAVARAHGATAQVAGGVPAMCDGVTQGRSGMELSLFSRDVIALSTVLALSHDVYDGALYLGICDKIVPGLLIGALAFGHLPAMFVPSGPMASGLSNADKVKMRQRAAQGLASRAELLEAEERSYHGAGTCTFYGTANSNQMLIEIMGLHLPGASFVNPGTALREAFTDAAVVRLIELTAVRGPALPIAHIIDERAIVNAVVGLHATGGSTNHLLHLIAIARAAGIHLTLEDIATLGDAVPLLASIYPNGTADVNRFQAAGGMRVLIAELLAAGLLHRDVNTVMGAGLDRYCNEPWLEDGELRWGPLGGGSRDRDVLRSVNDPFLKSGALRVVSGNLGIGAIKLSAVPADRHLIEAPAVVIDDPSELETLFKAGALERDLVAVVRFQGPRANGMPELHSLMPILGTLQDRGYRVALLTDGRLSGASGKVPAVIHLTPEASVGGPLALLRDGDLIRLDARAHRLEAQVGAGEWASRSPAQAPGTRDDELANARALFGLFRNAVGDALTGATIFTP